MALQDHSPSQGRKGFDLWKARLVHHNRRSGACQGEGLADLLVDHCTVAAAGGRLDTAGTADCIPAEVLAG